MLKHMVFGLLWLAGLFIGPWLDAFTPGSIPAWLVLFGGVWIMLCQAVRDEIGERQGEKLGGHDALWEQFGKELGTLAPAIGQLEAGNPEGALKMLKRRAEAISRNAKGEHHA